ncbi:hypothetical protein BLA29_015182, partial [Euroglyphus maynei]
MAVDFSRFTLMKILPNFPRRCISPIERQEKQLNHVLRWNVKWHRKKRRRKKKVLDNWHRKLEKN